MDLDVDLTVLASGCLGDGVRAQVSQPLGKGTKSGTAAKAPKGSGPSGSAKAMAPGPAASKARAQTLRQFNDAQSLLVKAWSCCRV